MIRVIELFSGVGAQRMALRNIGVNHISIGVCEIDKHAHKSYEAIHGLTPNFGDITKVDKLPSADLWTYSFPCTDLSIAGNQEGMTRGSGTRSGLLWEVERLLNISEKPKYLLLENVKQLVGKKFKKDFDEWIHVLEQMGYKNYWKVLNAKDFNVPQNRERVFMVSILGEDDYTFPSPNMLVEYMSGGVTMVNILDKPFILMNSKYYLDDVLLEYLKGYVSDKEFSLDSPDKIKRLSKMSFVLKNYVKFIDKNGYIPEKFNPYNCAVIKDIAPCQTTNVGHASSTAAVCINDEKGIRRLTSLESWRLMVFSDDDYYKAAAVNTDVQLYKQAGNSIVVPVLEGIFRSMFCEDKGDLDIKPITTDLF